MFKNRMGIEPALLSVTFSRWETRLREIHLAFGCTRPVVFNRRGSPFHSVPGTGFLVSLWGIIFFVTAKHVTRNFDLREIWVPYSSSDRDPMPILSVHQFNPVSADDTCNRDITIFIVDPERVDASRLGSELPLDISWYDYFDDYCENVKFYYRGVSPDLSRHDYEANDFAIKFVTGCGTYAGEGIDDDTHQISVNTEDIQSFDGHSGGPVLYLRGAGGGGYAPQLAGMLLLGTVTAKRMFFLSAHEIFWAVDATRARAGLGDPPF